MIKYGQEVWPMERYGNVASIYLKEVEFGYQVALHNIKMIELELVVVRVGLGGGLENTQQVKTMKFDACMATDKEGWIKEGEEENEYMIKNNVWWLEKLQYFPKDKKVLDTMWE